MPKVDLENESQAEGFIRLQILKSIFVNYFQNISYSASYEKDKKHMYIHIYTEIESETVIHRDRDERLLYTEIETGDSYRKIHTKNLNSRFS